MSWSDWTRGTEIEPSIYAADLARLGEQLDQVLGAGARILHFDIGDGHFVPPVTIGPVVMRSIEAMVHGSGGVLDCHLMVENPADHFTELAESGADSVTFHFEVTDDVESVVAQARSLGLGVGIAFNPGTEVDAVAAVVADVDLVLCMSIEPGYSGQTFMTEALPRIERLRALLPEFVHVQVDGGVNLDTAARARVAGANLLVAGSAVFYPDDVAAAYRELVETVS